MYKVLFVCLGNICRSPLADGLMRRKVEENNLELVVDSAGTAAYHIGNPPDYRMINTAKLKGTDISYLKARQFDVSDFDKFSRIYVMDKSNYQNVLKLSRNDADKQKVELILNLIEPNKNKEVPDPYYGGQDGFDLVYDLLDQATEKLITIYKNSKK